MTIDGLKFYIKDPRKLFFFLSSNGLLNWMSDEKYLSIAYRINMGKRLNLTNPQTYNEKIQWLKLHDRREIYTKMVDKYEAKKYVSDRIGSEYIIPSLGIWDSFDEINFDSLPTQFVLKCTHDSGGIVICKDKRRLDIDKAKRILNDCMRRNYYWVEREWPYKNVKPRILAEEFMEDKATGELRDYKFFTFDGKVKALFVASDRQNPNEETKFDFFDENYNHLEILNGHPNSISYPAKPLQFEKMKVLAETLSVDIPHLRVDFYEVNGQVYFGELTFSHWSGMVPFNPPKWDNIFGSWITAI